MATFECQERRMPKIEACLKAIRPGEPRRLQRDAAWPRASTCDKIVKGVQPICFENAVWAYTLGTAIAVKTRPEERC